MKRTRNAIRPLAMGLVSLTVLCLTSGCGGPSISPGPVVIAAITVAVNPDPVSPQASTDPDFEFLASFTVTVSESRGTGTTIDSVSVMDVTETSDGEDVETEEAPLFRADVSVGSDRIEGNSSGQIVFNVYYTLPGGGSEARIDIALSIIDDYGYEVGGDLEVRVP